MLKDRSQHPKVAPLTGLITTLDSRISVPGPSAGFRVKYADKTLIREAEIEALLHFYHCALLPVYGAQRAREFMCCGSWLPVSDKKS